MGPGPHPGPGPSGGRLRRFQDNRYLGTRDGMRVYDCDDPVQWASLEARSDTDDLVGLNLIQTFAPDTMAEARNRGFQPPEIVNLGNHLRTGS